ncbi:MAG: hypothetical protein K2J34_06705, partial [Muribaculaceae bacterium]|nr:hypothetical protein [Muribaculaceae bacterium]
MKKYVKKVTADALTALMRGGCFAGCSSSNENENSASDASKSGKTEYNIGICQLVQHDALDAATKGFKEKLTELGNANGITFKFDEQNASGEATNCTTIT